MTYWRRQTVLKTVQEATLRFAARQNPQLEIVPATLAATLNDMQSRADEAYREAKRSASHEPLQWNPSASRLFFEKLGPFLPIQVHRKELLKGGGFQVLALGLPLRALRLLDPSAISPLKVLIKGRSEDYFSQDTSVRTVVVPARDSSILTLALAQHFHKQEFTQPEFISVSKDLFREISIREEWEPLIELFTGIVGDQHATASAGSKLRVDVMGYAQEAPPPLLIRTDENGRCLVINGYSPLCKEMKGVYSQALTTNNRDTQDVIASMCHELYHHAQPAELDDAGEELHYLQTRGSLFLKVLRVLQEYQDLKKVRVSGG